LSCLVDFVRAARADASRGRFTPLPAQLSSRVRPRAQTLRSRPPARRRRSRTSRLRCRLPLCLPWLLALHIFLSRSLVLWSYDSWLWPVVFTD
jgi:hypothetical protein